MKCPDRKKKKRLVVARSWGKRESVISNGSRVSFMGDKNILELDSGDGCNPVNILKNK